MVTKKEAIEYLESCIENVKSEGEGKDLLGVYIMITDHTIVSDCHWSDKGSYKVVRK